ncbi:6,7-dimethyl-8-ribityllumazine synthase [uncultured Corynebacterium sp.]|uniref:6,7-dimethyl-8-ribityllumazine synthase n=1 Tax=uncultured Corynebacterium sp. TaxID=159447 RepID=UPI0025DA5064|nr:6,7-dimethyl-8-ribityllumazine synthase [uncultured Corynebacterium sp.]
MSGEGSPTITIEPRSAQGLRVAIVVSEWNRDITDELASQAREAGKTAGAEVTVIPVVGALEIPVVVKKATRAYDAVVALGCVIQGGTPHFDHVCNAVTYGLTKVAVDTETPVGNGVLTCTTHEQAVDRAGGPTAHENKGAEAMIAAIHTAQTLKRMAVD